VHVATGTPQSSLNAAAAYDAIAGGYDEQSRGDEWMRSALHRHYLRTFSRGQRVLDLGCGTGTDALLLAQHGIAVVAIDGSAAMLAQLRSKVEAAGLQHLVESRLLAIDDLGQLDGGFDGAYSSFAALSTVDLRAFAQQAGRLVRGRMVLHMLNRFSLWEWLGSAVRGQWRLPWAGKRSFTIGGQPVEHTLYFPRDAYAHFSDSFALRRVYSLGALRPPHTVSKVPKQAVARLEWLDVRLGGLPGVRNAGRFFVLDLERRA
jgi:SAM-dependent methyltransferase